VYTAPDFGRGTRFVKASAGFIFFLLFLAGLALVNLGTLEDRRSAQLRAPSAEELVSQRWRLAALRDARIAPAHPVDLLFTRGGLFAVEGACNRYTADYRLEAGGFGLDGLAGTEKTCEPRLEALDRELIDTIGSTAGLATDGTRLWLTAPDGERLARFAPAPADDGGP